MLAESYIHQLDSFAIQLTDSFGLRWYGLAYIAGFITAWLIIRWMGKRKFSPLKPEQAGDLIFAMVMGVLFGGRIGYGLFYDQSMFYTFSNEIPWWEVLAIHHGGMSSHGGIAGVLIAIILWGRKHNISIPHILDVSSICAIPGLCYGRIANFINAELWGRSLPTPMQDNPPWWSVKYPSEITEVWLSDPVTHQEKLALIEPLRSSVIGGETFYFNVVSQAQAGNQLVVETIQPLLTAWYPSQLFQALTDGPMLLIALVLIWWKPRKPGVIAGWFLIVYGILRVATEMYRQPDTNVSLIAGLTRGQLLSLLMVFLGVALVAVSAARRSEKLGGFRAMVTSG